MGYDLNRFLDQNINKEFLCLICQKVLKDPLLADSCEHIFCRQCIEQQLEVENKCPIDKKAVTHSQLRQPMRAFRNILNQLQIKCEFTCNGCEKYVKLDEIEDHIKSCEFKTTDSSDVLCVCGLKLTSNQLSGHQSNCIIHLNEELKQLRHTLNDLKNQKKNKSLKTENNYSMKPLFEEWICCGKQIKLIFTDMSEQQKSDIISRLEEGLNSNDKKFLKTLTNYLRVKYGDVWFALLFETTGPYIYAKGNYLLISIGQKRIRIFKTLKFSLLETIKESRSVSKPTIMKNSMNILMTDDVMQFALRALAFHEDFLQIASLVRQRLTEKYGKNWNCILSADSFGLSFTPKEKTSIHLKFANIVLIIWQCP